MCHRVVQTRAFQIHLGQSEDTASQNAKKKTNIDKQTDIDKLCDMHQLWSTLGIAGLVRVMPRYSTACNCCSPPGVWMEFEPPAVKRYCVRQCMIRGHSSWAVKGTACITHIDVTLPFCFAFWSVLMELHFVYVYISSLSKFSLTLSSCPAPLPKDVSLHALRAAVYPA